MGFSLKLDKSRLQELIHKASKEIVEAQAPEDEKTIIDFEASVVAKIPSQPVAESAKVISTGAIIFAEVDENIKEPSIWLATNKTKSQISTQAPAAPFKKRPAQRKFWRTVFQATEVLLLLVVIGIVIATVQSLQRKKRFVTIAPPAIKKTVNLEKMPETRPVPEAPPQKLSEQVELASKHPAPKSVSSPSAKIKPRTSKPYVRIKPIDLTSQSPRLRLSSNANDGELIKVSIKGVTGEVLGWPSFLAEKSLARSGGNDPEIKLSGLGVTAGYYTIEAELAGAKNVLQHMFIGSKKKYREGVRTHRKALAYRQQWEKKTLLRIALGMDALIKDLLAKYANLDTSKEWEDFFNDWRQKYRDLDSSEMRGLSARNQNDFAFPEIWYKARTLRQKLISEADELNSAFISSRRTASTGSHKKLAYEIDQLVTRIGDLSGWRNKSSK